MPLKFRFLILLSFFVFSLFFTSCTSSERPSTNTEPSTATGTYFEAPYEFSVGENPTTLITRDSNSDNISDLIYVLNPLKQEGRSGTEYGAIDLLQRDSNANTAFPFTALSTFSPEIPVWRQHISFADIDGDSIPDLVIAESGGDNITVMKSSEDGTSFTAMSVTAVGNKPLFITSGDWNQDGITDLAVVNRADNTVSVLKNEGSGNFSVTSFAVGKKPIKIIAGDWNADQAIDLVILSHDDTNIQIWLNDGTGEFALAQTHTTGKNPQNLLSGDWNADGVSDLAVSNRQDGNLSLFYGGDNGSFAEGVLVSAGKGPGVFAVADFNQDNRSDFIVGHSFTFKSGADSYLGGEFSLILSKNNGEQGQAAYETPELFASGTTPSGNIPASLILEDLNSDNKLDVLYSLPSHRKIAVLIGKF